jgi:hypothetical protein
MLKTKDSWMHSTRVSGFFRHTSVSSLDLEIQAGISGQMEWHPAHSISHGQRAVPHCFPIFRRDAVMERVAVYDHGQTSRCISRVIAPIRVKASDLALMDSRMETLWSI